MPLKRLSRVLLVRVTVSLRCRSFFLSLLIIYKLWNTNGHAPSFHPLNTQLQDHQHHYPQTLHLHLHSYHPHR